MIQSVSAGQLPTLISQTDGFPHSLFLRGRAAALQQPLISVVGTRNPTTYGLQACSYFVRELTERGFGIVSGLAVGIDAAAHRACLESNGITVAVLAHGLDTTYPRQNQALADRIVQSGGAVVSEFPEGVRPLKAYFPRRNRIISALGMATLIVEASKRSGSLITAHLAVNQGREVFVVPGPFHCDSFAGSHALIREGAKLVDCVEEILSDLPLAPPALLGGDTAPAVVWREREFWQQVFADLGGRATLLDLMELTGTSMHEVLSAIDTAQRLRQVECVGIQTWIWLG
jgi:DNA processing protein